MECELVLGFKVQSFSGVQRVQDFYFLWIVNGQLKLYLFPLTRPTLKNCPYPKNLLQFFIQDYFFIIVNYRGKNFMFMKDTLSDNAFNDSLLCKYYFCNQVLAILEQLKTNFNLYKT